MKKQYTKKQITEAIKYWKKRLDESIAKPQKLRLTAQFDEPVGVDELYKPETLDDLGVDLANCAVQAIFAGDREHPVSSVELGSHPNGGDDVLVLKLDNDYPMNYADFCAAVQKFAKGRNLAFLLEPEDGGYYVAYSVRVISDAGITADQFHFMVKPQNRL